MHSYSTNESRVVLYGIIGVFAVGLAWLIVAVTSHFSWPQWLVSAPSMGATYTLVYKIFDLVLWKQPWLRTLGLVDVSDISGCYKGDLISTWKDADGKPVTKDVVFDIKQTWTKIEVAMTVGSGSSTSRSKSAVASVSNSANATQLVYVYRNQVAPGVADDDMGDHDGAADIEIKPDGSLTGRYFNSRPRAGTLRAQLVNNGQG